MNEYDRYIEKLKEEGYQGFYCSGECGCLFTDDIPCLRDLDEFNLYDFECKPGYILKEEDFSEEDKLLWEGYPFIITGVKR